MAVELDKALGAGGKLTIDFLQYCILTQRTDAIFVYLAREYRFRPTIDGAFALFEAFCAEKAIAKLPLPDMLPPKSPHLLWEVQKIRQSIEDYKKFVPTEKVPDPPRVVHPTIIMFEPYVAALRALPDAGMHLAAQEFDPELAPIEHLANGEMNFDQILFIQNIWVDKLRPTLIAGGFWQIASLGQF
jgi:hypothetical protein